jgi:DNA-binding NarL/FixJ family response regulator
MLQSFNESSLGTPIMEKPRIIIADDHPLVLEGFCRILSAEYEVVATALDGLSLLESARKLRPDVILLDVAMPLLNGIESARQLREVSPNSKVICVTQHVDREYVMAAFRAGVSAYVLKQSASHELFNAITAALEGKIYVSQPLASFIPENGTADLERLPASFGQELTPRQRQVLQLIAEGKTAKEIAKHLNISPKTAEFHRARIMDELGLRTTAELTRYAMSKGIV